MPLCQPLGDAARPVAREAVGAGVRFVGVLRGRAEGTEPASQTALPSGHSRRAATGAARSKARLRRVRPTDRDESDFALIQVVTRSCVLRASSNTSRTAQQGHTGGAGGSALSRQLPFVRA